MKVVLNTREIQEWLINRIAELLEVAPNTIDIREPFSNYGISSLDIVELSGDLEDWLGRRLAPTVAYDFPNILSLSRYLAEGMEQDQSTITPSPPSGNANEPIAIIGLGCRFPGAKDPESFWQLLQDGVDAIREIPSDRWSKEAFFHPDPSVPGKSISYWGGFLDHIDQFDPFYFGISPVEAENMDPQQRLLLELAHETLDDAGLVTEEIDGTKTGVFVGISVNEYTALQFGDPSRITAHSGTGSALSIAANRISYYFNLRGPSVAIDTACSSSLSAIHLACQSLRNGECTMALAGGVSMILSPAHSIAFTKAGVLAPDGRCKTFDARADGYVRGEGGGLVILKPFSKALADGDAIQAVILGSTMRQDGRTNGLIAPSQESQESLLRETYQVSGISPDKVQYVEAHGTGTILGDSMEANALGAVVGNNRTNGPCMIGSVKTNIGHLEAAAGIAGLIKVVLSLQHRSIPPSLHYQSPNPHVHFDQLNLKVPNEPYAWPSHSGPALAGVSSFGFGGTNVHMIIREAALDKPEKSNQLTDSSENSKWHLLPLSANSYETLRSLAGTFEDLLAGSHSIPIKNICRTASHRRSQYDYRLVAIGQSREELQGSLQAFRAGDRDAAPFLEGELPQRFTRIAFVFPGQGGQWLGMGRELLQQEPVFYKTIKQIDELIQTKYGWSLLEALNAEGDERYLEEINMIQPVLFAIQVALTALWRFWGITPDAVVGHSMGEVAAAHVAGILSLEDAIQIICGRSLLLRPLRGQGSMLVTGLSQDQAQILLEEYDRNIDIAVINSPATTVLSGDPKTIEAVKTFLEQGHLFCKLVKVDVASHSPQMEQLRPELLKTLEEIKPQLAEIPIYSTVSGIREDGLAFNGEYWMDNLRKPVLFSAAIDQLLVDGYTTFIEIGPHPVLLGAIQQTAQAHTRQVELLPSLRRDIPESEVLLNTLGALYINGHSVAWENLYPAGGQYIRLPLMPWQRQRYWIESGSSNSISPWQWVQSGSKPSHSLLGNRINLANSPTTFLWQASIHGNTMLFLNDHRIEDAIVYPSAAYIEMALQAVKATGLYKTHEISGFVFKESMILLSDKPRTIQTIVSPGEANAYAFNVYSQVNSEEEWVEHVSADLMQQASVDDWKVPEGYPIDIIREQSSAAYAAEPFYQALASRGIQYGPTFRGVQHVWRKDQEAVGLIQVPDLVSDEIDSYQLHPALLDACLQVLAITQGESISHNFYLPVACGQIRVFASSDRIKWSHVQMRSTPDAGDDLIHADIRLLTENQEVVAELMDFQLQRTSRRIRHLLSQEDSWLYKLGWQVQDFEKTPSDPFRQSKYWLIFADDEGFGEALAEQLEATGDYCYLLFCGATLKKLENAPYETLSEIIGQQLQKIPGSLHGVIHLWSLSIPISSSNKVAEQMYGSNSVLELVQTLAARLAGMPRLLLVTEGAQAVLSGEPIAIEQSPLWGFGKVISFEFPELECTRIDLDPQQTKANTILELMKQISTDGREDQIAFRAGRRYVYRLLPFTLQPYDPPAQLFRADSTYLITGGLGGLGLETAKWMVQRGAQHLVLMGRNAPGPSAYEIIRQLQAKDVEIFVTRGDVSDRTQLDHILEEISEQMPVLRGVFHAAGILDDGSLLNLNKERIQKVMAPKVAGSWNLHEATLQLPLDYFVLYSSAVSVLGSPGQANYAAASAYLDAMTYYRRQLGLPAISINWGPWAEVGLAAETLEKLEKESTSTQHLVKVITVENGLEIQEQLLRQSEPQVLVLPFDLKDLIELYPTAAGMPFLAEVGGNETHVARLYARPKLRQEYVAPRNDMERKIAELWRQTLHIDRVGIHDSFFELGGDSVLAAQILSLAQKTFGIRINPQDAFQAFTIARLAEMLEEEILNQLESMTEEEAQRLLSKNN